MSARERPGNPGFNTGGGVKDNNVAWGQIGSVLGGEPLAIEYNQGVLEDKPTEEDQAVAQSSRKQVNSDN